VAYGNGEGQRLDMKSLSGGSRFKIVGDSPYQIKNITIKAKDTICVVLDSGTALVVQQPEGSPDFMLLSKLREFKP